MSNRYLNIRFSALLVAAVSAVSSFALGNEKASSEKPVALEKVKLALNWKPEPQFGGFYAARILGADKKHGVELEVVAGGAGTPVVQMIASGQFDFGIASGDELVVSRVRGLDLVALFAVYQTNPQGIMTRAERGFESLADVFKNGGTVAMQKGLPYALFLQKKYASGMKASVVPYLGGISNFMGRQDHSQQCFVTSEPLIAERQGTKTKTFLVAESGYNPYTTVVVTRKSLLKEKPELVKNVVQAIRSGWRGYLDDPAATNVEMNKLNPSIEVESMKEMSEAQRALIEPKGQKPEALGKMSNARWNELSSQLQLMKVIDKKPSQEPFFVEL